MTSCQIIHWFSVSNFFLPLSLKLHAQLDAALYLSVIVQVFGGAK